ncbi:MAG: PHB depolymerase family esterase [Rhodoferax sp.]|uniref:extracellular catalytic domain type 1 short-chain-length polyhydroxyalkanoate depolymerase n=1 Tax=Rhodoferax sp. TaxID=50421 RepID=UPI0026077A56|nr:PHB depolymerase family esterase [Rhodoferax sp.]MDD2881016.1 PHB depolymerase family esterase [Rhodoferax sp.]
MTRRVRSTVFSRAIQRSLKALTRSAIRAGTKAVAQALRPSKPAAQKSLARKTVARKPAASKTTPARAKATKTVQLRAGFTAGMAGVQRYRLFVPPGARRRARLPLLVMLHGCTQSADAFASSTRMNQIAAKEGFVVLYPEQNHLANLQGCWNWHQTRSGQAQAEAETILATIHQVCQLQAIDPARIALAGLSAGASMAALLAVRHPKSFGAIAMHSGVAPGIAHATASALTAMRGGGVATPLSPLAAGTHLPALLVIQGSADHLVAPSNGATAAHLWAAREGAAPAKPRTVQRGARLPATLTDYKVKGRLVATLCVVQGLGHAWSGGAASQNFSDPKGPDASRMIWAFALKQFAKLAA